MKYHVKVFAKIKRSVTFLVLWVKTLGSLGFAFVVRFSLLFIVFSMLGHFLGLQCFLLTKALRVAKLAEAGLTLCRYLIFRFC